MNDDDFKAAMQAAADAPQTPAERFVLANDWMPMQVAINVMRLYPLDPDFYESGEFIRRCGDQAMNYAVLKKREFDHLVGWMALRFKQSTESTASAEDIHNSIHLAIKHAENEQMPAGVDA